MPNCPHCGQEMELGSESCSACGQSLTTHEESAVSASVPERIQIKEVKIGEYFKEGWKLFKKYPAGFISYVIIVSLILNIIPVLINFIVPIIGILVGFALIYPLHAGFFVVNAKLLNNKTPVFSDFFKGFQFFPQLALLGVVSIILGLIGLILLIVPGVYLFVSYLFAYMFVVDRRLNFWRAMELSRRSVQTRWFSIFSLFFLLVLIALGPYLLLVMMWLLHVPILYIYSILLIIILFLLITLVTVSLTHCIATVAYAEIFGLESAHNI